MVDTNASPSGAPSSNPTIARWLLELQDIPFSGRARRRLVACAVAAGLHLAGTPRAPPIPATYHCTTNDHCVEQQDVSQQWRERSRSLARRLAINTSPDPAPAVCVLAPALAYLLYKTKRIVVKLDSHIFYFHPVTFCFSVVGFVSNAYFVVFCVSWKSLRHYVVVEHDLDLPLLRAVVRYRCGLARLPVPDFSGPFALVAINFDRISILILDFDSICNKQRHLRRSASASASMRQQQQQV